MKKLSIIVPVFNTAKYVERTIESILDQGLDENQYEILIINDGSTDNSLEICNKYRTLSNVEIISQENKGVSSARNLGIQKSSGDYVYFVDSDDILAKNGLNYVISNFELSRYDIIRIWTKIIYNKEQFITEEEIHGHKNFEGNGIDYIAEFGLEASCYSMIFKKDFLINHDISFQPIIMGEDYLFSSSALLANPQVLSTTCRIYNYIIRQGSAMTNKNNDHLKRCIESQIIANEKLFSIIQSKNILFMNPKAFKNAFQSMSSRLLMVFSRVFQTRLQYKEVKHYLLRCQKMGLLPLQNIGSSPKLIIARFIINILYYFPFSYYLFSFVTISVYPLFIKTFNRNK